jgi:hypothetical protein
MRNAAGVRELVCFDQEAEPPTLRVWDAVDGDLVERQLDELAAPSHCLPGIWVVVGDVLRLARLEDGRLFPTPAEHEREAAERERETAERERDLRLAAEARVRELEAELRRRDADG